MRDIHQIVPVSLGDRSYDIHIGPGLLAKSGELVADVLPPGARAAVVTDENVARYHLDSVLASMEAFGIGATVVRVPAGEPSKCYPTLQDVVERILDARLERGDAVIALGGGVIGDLAGFAAAIARRGMRFVQMPTSLLAQVDSSVGGKTGINSPHGKNLVGAFYQPQLVLADTDALDTLPDREFRAGYAEVVKYGLIDRPDFFAWLERQWPAIRAGGPERINAIAESCRAKSAVVARDERETGDRALLNLGHTFGHALEAAAKFDPEIIVHGEGVAIGMVMAHEFSARMNLASPDDAKRVAAHLETAGLPTNLNGLKAVAGNADRMLDFIAQDKKVTRGALNFILTRGIGQAFVARDVPASEVHAYLAGAIGE
ncbi:3-dehydroquinate synthase [Oricola cellulosilytica]|uniref:3-dehydroquinate synthase n=1 Tax=Oricola cellulosilytica TaxID=1429082 RepID=A0A4R0PBM0_9HYPH|nr:3-dehydroquinate synthase [Oricola cellulosilytica]TCD13747.1 3-dehydroquinate synthase [Oricola cellulosilytica]